MINYNLTKILALLLCSFQLSAQKNSLPKGGGEYKHPVDHCISETKHEEIVQKLEYSKRELYSKKVLPLPKKVRSVPLQWPLQQASGYNYCGYYGISNFVDHNTSYPNQLQDYNCGTRTYDLSSGYNHQGTDIFLWPFSWNMVNDNQVEVIAAAPGVIIGKDDGNPHTNCDFSNPNWNAVYVQHLDGSVAWYGHMKNGSLTTKPVGASVVLGEKLGIVASSGSSTGPHLHFELYNAANQLVDPYQGTCNAISGWWTTQKPYFESSVNAAFTHNAAPVFNACPNPDNTNIDVNFQPGDVIYFAGYYHDQVNGSVATYTITRPDNSIFATWTQTFNTFYSASYWYWWDNLPLNAPAGVWNFSISYQGQTCNQPFQVGGSFPLNIATIQLQAFQQQDYNKLFWQVTDRSEDILFYEVEQSEDGVHFSTLKTIQSNNESEFHVEDYTSASLTYYRVHVHYSDYTTLYSNVVTVRRRPIPEIEIYPNPSHSTIHVLNADGKEKVLYNYLGQELLRSVLDILSIETLPEGIYMLRCGTRSCTVVIR